MYNPLEARKTLNDLYGWRDYGEKHEESIFTHWFQSFYLFERFGIDKRKAHYSSLINSGLMTRSEALEKLKTCPVYPQIGLEAKVMSYPKRSHNEFAQDKWYGRISKTVKFLKKCGIVQAS